MRSRLLLFCVVALLAVAVSATAAQSRANKPATSKAVAAKPSLPAKQPTEAQKVAQATNAAGSDNYAEVVRVLPEEEVKTWDPALDYAQTAFFLLGKSYQHLNQWDKAQGWYQKYLAVKPDGLYGNDCRAQLGIIDTTHWDALVAAVNALIADPKLSSDERYRAGSKLIDEAVKTSIPGVSHDSDVVYAQAVLENGVQKTDDARKHFTDYQKTYPDGRRIGQVNFYVSQFEQPRLLYIQSRQLWTVMEDGSSPRSLTTSEQGEVESASLSPGQDYVAVLMRSKDNSHDIRILNLRDPQASPGSIWNCTGDSDSVRAFGWSTSLELPGQTRYVAFVGPDKTGDYAIWICDITQTNPIPEKLAHSDTPRSDLRQLSFSWAPGGKFIAFCAAGGHIYISQPPFSTAQSLDPDVTAVGSANLTWAVGTDPSSEPVLFGLNSRGAFVLDGKVILTGKPTVRFLDRINRSPVANFGVSSDGAVMGITRVQAKDVLELYRVKEQQPLGQPVGRMKAYAFSPFGSQLAYRTELGVYASRLDDNREHDVRLSGTDANTEFQWSPVGNQVLCWQKGSITLCYDRIQLAKGDVSDPPKTVYKDPKWALDDRAVAIQRLQEDQMSIVLLSRKATGGQGRTRVVDLNYNDKGGAQLVDWIY